MINSWSISGLLQVHFEIYKVDHYLGVALRLHISSHNAKAHPWPAVPGNEGGYNGMERPLSRGKNICMTHGEAEHLTPVLQHKSQTRGAHP